MNKPTLIFDYDGCIFDSPQAICKTYDLLYKNHANFTPSSTLPLDKYSMKDVCPLCDNVLDLFEMKLFFEYLEPFENAIDIIKLLAETFDITIVSVGTPENIKLKIDSISYWFGKLVKFVPIISYDRQCKMDKSIINSNMKICLDDSELCLESFDTSSSLSRGIKYCGSVPTNHNIIYGKEYEWNTNNPNNYPRCKNWLEVYNYIILLTHGSNGLDEDILNHNILATFNNDIIYK